MSLTSADALDGEYDVCVVGTGPAGLACALGCRERGMKVLLLEAGGKQPTPGKPDLLAADIAQPTGHDPTEIVSASALGGTSHWWGGRAVALDPIDFATWPIAYDDMPPWYRDAAKFLGVETMHEGPAPGAFAQLTRFSATRDEMWCPQINMAKRWRAQLEAVNGPAIVLGARVIGLEHDARRVTGLRVRIGDAERRARARNFVLACGGLGALKLLLLAQREAPHLFGGPNGKLGVGYMGHLTGAICDLAPADVNQIDAFGFRPMGGDVFARRQIQARAETVRGEGLGNIGFWLDNASNDNPAHGSSVASAKYVAARMSRGLASPGRRRDEAPLGPHFQNIARAPFAAAGGLMRVGYLLAMARITGRLPRSRTFLQAGNGAWHMRYHAEQRPDPANRISLSTNSVDSAGLPKLAITFRFAEREIESVLRAHELLDTDLQAAGAGRLKWKGTREECAQMARDFARDGYHQIGGAAMSRSADDGVVDPDCRTHDLANLWIASSSVFPSGGQANPTLTIIALARRLAERLKRA